MRRLNRDGALEAGTLAMQQWTCRGEPSAAIRTFVDPREPDFLILDYKTRIGAEPWQPVCELVALETTPFHYGGSRVWFACPGCSSRRAVLFGVGGRFRCRAYHTLAHSSIWASAGDRAARRREAAQKRLGGEPNAMHAVPPAKPKGMHWRTYERLVAGLHHAWRSEQDEHHAEMLALVVWIDTQL